MVAARAFALLAFVLAAHAAWHAPAAAHAQPAPPPATSAPVVLEADRIVFDAAASRLVATGRVRARSSAFLLWADEVTYDAAREEVVASGNVILEEDGRRLAARAIRYDLRRRLATATDARGVHEQIYLQARAVEATRDTLRAMDALVTLCDPDAPLYRVVARRATVTPDRYLVAEEASFYLGETRLFTLPSWRFRLDAPEESLIQPSVGMDPTSGPWIAAAYRYPVGPLRARAFVRYNGNLGFELHHRFTYEPSGWALSLNTGAFRDPDNRRYDALELEFRTDAARVDGTPFTHRLTVRAGDYRDRTNDRRGLRFDAAVHVTSDTFAISDRLTGSLGASLRVAWYEDRTVVFPVVQPRLRYRFDDRSYVSLSHSYVDSYGRSPFAFDTPTRESVTTLTYTLTDRPFTYQIGAQYDFFSSHVKVIAGLAADYGRWSGSITATFNTTTSRFDDVDVAATFRCDCLTVSATYRAVRGEFWLNVIPIPSPRLPAHAPQPPGPPAEPPEPAP